MTAPQAELTPRKVDVAYEQLKDLLVTLQIEPGALIDEGALMERLDIGRTPLREAVQWLSHEGLIVHVPRRGNWASPLSFIDFRQMVEARRIVEPAAAALAAQRIDADQARRIRNEIVQAEEFLIEGNFAECVRVDQRFHSMIAHATQNGPLAQMVDRVNQALSRYWYFSFVHVQEVGLAFRQHQEILATIERGDAAEAERLMHEHIDLFLRRIQEALVWHGSTRGDGSEGGNEDHAAGTQFDNRS